VPLQLLLPLSSCNRLIDHRRRRFPVAVAPFPLPHCHCSHHEQQSKGATSMALGHWSNCNGNEARATTIDGIAIMLLSERKTSTIVVVENVQNVWLTNIPDILRFD
jgi:hypothetical protein